MRRELRHLASDSVVYGLSGFFVKFGGLLLIPVYARIFTEAGFGTIALVTATAGFAGLFTVLGLDSAAGRWFFDTEEPAHRQATIASWAYAQLVAACAMSVVFVVGAPAMARIIVGDESAAVLFRLAGLALPLGVIPSVTNNWLRMQRRARATALFAVTFTLAQAGATLIFLFLFQAQEAGVFLGQIAGGAVMTVTGVAMLRGWVGPSAFDRKRLRDLFRYAIPLIPAGVATWVVAVSDRYFVEAFTSTSDVGVYAMGSVIAGGVAIGTLAFQQAWGPWAMSFHTDADAGTTYARAMSTYVFLAALAATALSLVSPEVIRIIATEKYVRAAPVVPYLTYGHVMAGLAFIAGLGLFIAKRSRPLAAALIASGVVMIIVNLALVPVVGFVGAAIGTLAAQIVVPVYAFVRSQRVHPFPYRIGPAAAFLVTGFLVAVFGWRWQPAGLVVSLGGKALMLLGLASLGLLLGLIPSPLSPRSRSGASVVR